MPKISIIVPVYNVKTYIERSARSLLDQTLDSLEYIFIDDCGTDGTLDVLERVIREYPDRQSQIKIIRHSQNEGVSRSRQDGIDAATGEYIIHCDPDDWVEHDMYDRLYQIAKEDDADIVLCGYNGINDGKILRYEESLDEYSNESLLRAISGQGKKRIHGSLCNKLIRSELCKAAYFPKEINYCEDVFLLFQILQNKELKISYTSECLYNYLQDRPGSLYKSYSPQALEMDRRLIDQILSPDFLPTTYQSTKYSFVISTIYYRAFLNGQITNEEFAKYYGKYSSFLKYNNQLHPSEKISLRLAMGGYLNGARTIRIGLIKTHQLLKRLKQLF